jgi:serine/threonine-protein kinase
VNADGTGEVTRLTDSPESQLASSWSPNGKFIAFQANRGAKGYDLMILPMEGDDVRGWKPGTAREFLATPATELSPMFSPNGRWIMYRSTEAGGRLEVYVRPFLGSGGPWRISTEGGTHPLWSSAHELLFAEDARVMFARYSEVGHSFNVDKPQIWSPIGYRAVGLGSVGAPYDLHPDGERLAIRAARDQTVVNDRVVFVSNFFEYLRAIAPAEK